MYPFEVRGARRCLRFALKETQMTQQQIKVMYEASFFTPKNPRTLISTLRKYNDIQSRNPTLEPQTTTP